MIDFSFRLSNPFSDRWATLYYKDGLLGKHKAAEIQVFKDNTIISFAFRFTTRTDHAGAGLDIGLFGYSVTMGYHDTRHWNDEEGRYNMYRNDGTSY